ncbi:hypothetical protein LPJ64_002767 [Coemansia asiatica]|uniref:Enhancer of mRNA-decapping protein 4 WD40 repeat region domain-containing protein n=1 Tax=Coemansia asiatica TaxID=1052880 RepID=A0A9W7XMD8_9FUNG|nr:hypothetical protein LPJ64_002767 [Coemansia asiatica]
MENNASHTNSLFNSFASADHLSRRRTEQHLASNSQSPVPASLSGQEALRRGSNFSSPSQSTNTSTQSVAGSTPQMSSNEVSFSLLQTLLKPQQAAAPTTYSAPQMLIQVAELEKSFGQLSAVPAAPTAPTAPAASALPAGQPMAEKSQPNNPIDMLRRMMAAQGGSASISVGSGISTNASTNGSERASNDTPTIRQPQQALSDATSPALGFIGTASLQSQPLNRYQQKPQSSSVYTSPRLGASAAPRSSSGAATPAASGSSTPKKQAKVPSLFIDTSKIKPGEKPEIVPISLLQQPSRFRAGRLISVSRDYICYAVRSKEGGRIRVIHQLHGQLAKMQGHTDAIIDMAFHPCSKEPGMPQILASLGKDNRLIVWLVSPVNMAASSAEDAISYEPFINVDSGGDAKFTCLSWRSQIVNDTMELCVGTDKGIMLIRAPVPSAHDNHSEQSNDGLVIVPVPTESAVTAIERIGLHWLIAGTADRLVRIYELDKQWDTSSAPCKVLSDLTKCEQPVDTLIYMTPACKEDGAGHVVFGYSMNKKMQFWWLGNNLDQITRLQRISFTGPPTKIASAFAAISWADQGRCLTAAVSHSPSVIFVLSSSGRGASMLLEKPVGYSLDEEQPTLSLVSAVEPPVSDSTLGPCLSIYSVHTRLVQQLQIPNFSTVEYHKVPDPAAVFSQNASLSVPPSGSTVPIDSAIMAAGYQRLSSQQPADDSQPSVPSATEQRSVNNTSDGISSELQAELVSQIKAQITASFAELQIKKLDQHTNLALSADAEARLVEQISARVESRVIQSMAAVMEKTLIPAYNRATASMFEQMHSTFEAGLREWWMRFAQMMPPPPPPPQIATPLSHIPMMPQPQQQQQQQQHAPPSSFNMPMPTSSSGEPGQNHLEAIMNLLNMQQTANRQQNQ